METLSLAIDEKQKQQIQQFFADEQTIPNNNEFVETQWKYKKIRIILYKSNKLVLQGEEIDELLKLLNLSKKEFEFDENYKYEIGSDETGVGDFFGGVVVCAVKLDKVTFEKIQKKFNIKDSKKLKDEYILEIYPKLIKEVSYKISHVSPLEYNKMLKEYNNSHFVKAFLHNQAISSLVEQNSFVCIDQFVNDKKYYEYLLRMKIKDVIKINCFVTQGESKHYSIALASVIARGWYLTQMNKISEKLNIKIPLGSWNDNIKKTALTILNQYGQNLLVKLCKTDFKVFEELISSVKNS